MFRDSPQNTSDGHVEGLEADNWQAEAQNDVGRGKDHEKFIHTQHADVPGRGDSLYRATIFREPENRSSDALPCLLPL